MRIGDWSSDVCSSDLAFGGLNARAGINTLRLRKVNIVSQAQFDALRALATERASPREPAPASDAREISFGEEIYRVGTGDPVIYEMDLYAQIGRASCRERVCQYV